MLDEIRIISYFGKMNWKKNLGKWLLILGNVGFWIVLHIAWWMIFWEKQTMIGNQTDELLKGGTINKLLNSIVLTITAIAPFMIIIYTNWFWLVKNYLAAQKYWAYIWRLFLLLLGMSFLMSFHPDLDESKTYLDSNTNLFNRIIIPNTLVIFNTAFWITLFTTPLYLSYNWFQQNTLLANIKSEHLETELSFLKSQINPHFFFNTLNNLYALTLENSKAAPEVILKLSDLMRYTIYDGKESSVLLGQEVIFIENYLALQRIRLHKKSEITFQQNIGNLKLAVPPLLFVIFLENAFKHGVETLRDNAIVDIQLTEKERVVKFYILNNYDHEERKKSNGLGLENIKRRLKLLFGDHYKLEIVDQENTYRVYLTINLNQ